MCQTPQETMSLPSPTLTTTVEQAAPTPATAAAATATQQTGRRILVNTSAMAGSSLWRIAISFALQVLIARQLGAVSMGQYTIALAYLNVCQIISELGLPALLIRDLAQQPWLRKSYFRWALWIQIGAACLTWLGLIGITALLPLPAVTQQLLWIVGASLPFYAITSVCQLIFQAGERMEYVMGVEFFVNTLILVLSVVVIFSGGAIGHLIVVLVLTQLASATISLILLWRSRLLRGTQQAVTWQWSLLWRRSSPFFTLALADVLLQRADIVLLSIFGGEAIAGLYSAAYNLLRVALKLIQNFWAALYPTLSRLFYQQPSHYQRLARFALHYTVLVLVAGAAIGSGITTEILQLVYGNEYTSSTVVLRMLLWMAPFYLLESYTQTLLMVERRPLHSLWISGLHLLTLLLLLPLLMSDQVPLLRNLAHWLLADNPAGNWVNNSENVTLTMAALAALFASGIGALSSLYLLRRWSLPVQLRRPWLTLCLIVLLSFVSNSLPIFWLGRLCIVIVVFLLVAWFGGLVAVQDIHLLRRILGDKAK